MTSKTNRRIFVSDIHMGPEESIFPATGSPYGWLTGKEAEILTRFLKSEIVQNANELILNGDVVDLWVAPIDVAPPTLAGIVSAPQNSSVLQTLRDLREKGVAIHYIRGNHDMNIDWEGATQVLPCTEFHEHAYEIHSDFRVEHGHRKCMFNGPDPKGRAHPLGYYITRVVATMENRTGAKVNFWSVLNRKQLTQWAKAGDNLADRVFNFITQMAGVSDDDIIMENGTTRTISSIGEEYADLYSEFGGGLDSVLAEWNPWFGMGVVAGKVTIVGHSHEHGFSPVADRGIFLNTGTWSSRETYFGHSYTENDVLKVKLMQWKKGKARRVAG